MDCKNIKVGDLVKFKVGFWETNYGEITKVKMILESSENESNGVEYEVKLIGNSKDNYCVITEEKIKNIYKKQVD